MTFFLAFLLGFGALAGCDLEYAGPGVGAGEECGAGRFFVFLGAGVGAGCVDGAGASVGAGVLDAVG